MGHPKHAGHFQSPDHDFESKSTKYKLLGSLKNLYIKTLVIINELQIRLCTLWAIDEHSFPFWAKINNLIIRYLIILTFKNFIQRGLMTNITFLTNDNIFKG